MILEKHNIYDTDTTKTNKSDYKFKTVKQNILYGSSGLKKSAFKRSDFKVLLTLNHLDSNYLANVYSTAGICPIKYYNDFYILVKTPDKDLKLPYGNQLYYFDTLNVSLTKLKYNQLLKEPATYSPGEVTMYNYSDLAEYRFYISKPKMEFTIGKSLGKL